MSSTRNTTAKFDARFNPVYRVDWSSESVGKRIGATKRRIRWCFGFSNAQEISKGCTGPDCRGEEHNIVIVWSILSGKAQVTMDGKDIYTSVSRKSETKFETSWTMEGGHIIKLIAYAATPLFPEPKFKQYDFLLDGISFFKMPHIYQLGRKNNLSSSSSSSSSYPPRSFQLPVMVENKGDDDDEDDNDNDSNMEDSSSVNSTMAVRDFQGPPPRPYISVPAMVDDETPTSESVRDLLDFGNPAPTEHRMDSPAKRLENVNQSPVISQELVCHTPNQSWSVNKELSNHPNGGEMQHNQIPYGYEQGFQNNGQHQQELLQPTYPKQTCHNQGQYDNHVEPTTYRFYETESSTIETSRFSGNPASPALTMQPMTYQQEEEIRDCPPPVSLEGAFKSLVNLDDICVEAEKAETFKYRPPQNQYHSKPLPALQPDWKLGNHASLDDIKGAAPPKTAPSKDIMRTPVIHHVPSQQGMMVVYGEASHSNQSARNIHYQTNTIYGH